MKILQALMLLTAALVAAGQRPSFAGSRPIGYPELVNRTTTPSGLEDKFGEGTTQRLPIEAGGDRDLVDRLSKLPIDKQPFWFINWQAYEANRDKPQTYPLRPNPFIDSLQNTANTNTGVSNVNSGSAAANAGSASANTGSINPNSGPITPNSDSINLNPGTVNPNPSLDDGSQNRISNKNGNPNVSDNSSAIKFIDVKDDTDTKNLDIATESNTGKSDPPFVISVPLISIYLDREENAPTTIFNNNPSNTDTNVKKNVETQNVDITKKPESNEPVKNVDSKTSYVIPSDGSDSKNIVATTITNNVNDIVKEPSKPEINTEIKISETDRISNTDSTADKKEEQLTLNAGDNEKPIVLSKDNKKLVTDTSTERKYKHSRVQFSSEEDDDYADIKVKDNIKLFPGIIQRYKK